MSTIFLKRKKKYKGSINNLKCPTSFTIIREMQVKLKLFSGSISLKPFGKQIITNAGVNMGTGGPLHVIAGSVN